MQFLFRNTKEIEGSIDEFLDSINEAGLAFKKGIEEYLEGEYSDFKLRVSQVDELENRADALRRAIENKLYSHSLIPEHRGDVLGLLETLDNVLDRMKRTIFQFDIERPNVQKELHTKFNDLVEASMKAAEEVIYAARAFFREINAVKNHLHKVTYYEKEADRMADQLKRLIFKMNIDLASKTQLRYFVNSIADVSDYAEDVSDRLSIYSIKRMV